MRFQLGYVSQPSSHAERISVICWHVSPCPCSIRCPSWVCWLSSWQAWKYPPEMDSHPEELLLLLRGFLLGRLLRYLLLGLLCASHMRFPPIFHLGVSIPLSNASSPIRNMTTSRSAHFL